MLRTGHYNSSNRIRSPGEAGRAPAITATAHKLARVVYNLMRSGVKYMKKSEQEHAEEQREKLERSFHRRALELGYEVRKVAPPPDVETETENETA